MSDEYQGRWDISYVEKPRRGQGISMLSALHLQGVKDHHPEAWKDMVSLVKAIDDGRFQRHLDKIDRERKERKKNVPRRSDKK